LAECLVCCTGCWSGVVVLVENKSLPRAPGRGGDKWCAAGVGFAGGGSQLGFVVVWKNDSTRLGRCRTRYEHFVVVRDGIQVCYQFSSLHFPPRRRPITSPPFRPRTGYRPNKAAAKSRGFHVPGSWRACGRCAGPANCITMAN
jgi:hypothetical protein